MSPLRAPASRIAGRRIVPASLLAMFVFAWPAAVRAAAQEPASEDSVCRVFGRVLDAETGEPVVGALVWLESAADASFLAGRETSTDGSFSIEATACTPALLHTNMIGYVDTAERVTFEGGDRMRAITIRLDRRPLELEELRVEVERSARLSDVGFYARKAWVEASGKDLGEFYDPEEVEARGQSLHTVTAIVGNSRMDFIYRETATCPGPSYYIDGTRFRSDSAAVRMLRYGLRPKDVEGIEIYRPIHGSVPEEYRDHNSTTCGAVVVWTKQAEPAEPPQIAVELCEPSDDPNGMSFGGVVSDELTGVRLPASYVTLTIDYGSGEPEEDETVADADGRYRFCDLLEWPESIQARYGTAVAEPFPIDQSREEPGYFEIDLELAVIRPGSVVGVVEGAGQLDPEVALEGTDLVSGLDERGYFEIHDVVPGDYEVIVRRSEEVLLRREVTIRTGATEALTLILSGTG